MSNQTNFPEFTAEHTKAAAEWRGRQTGAFQDPIFARVVQYALADESLRARLLSNPKDVLEQYGVSISPQLEIRVIEDTETVRHIILPRISQGKTATAVDLTDDDLITINRSRVGGDNRNSADRGDGSDSGDSQQDFRDKPDTGDANQDWADS